MSNFAMITSGGLTSVTEASIHGTLIDVRYFIPVYDWRIDPTISPITSASNEDISTITEASDTSPYGEKIWNSEGYTLSETGIALISGSNTLFQDGANIDIVTNSVQQQSQSINLYNGIPLTNTISASSVSVAPSESSSTWQLYDGQTIIGNNDRPNNDNTDYWSVVEYSSLLSDTGRSAASFKCRMNKDVGEFKFNKVALYAVKLDINYQPYGEPFLFAQLILKRPEIKSNIVNGGLDEAVIEFQLELSSPTIDINWDSVIYGNGNDYFERVTEDGSLHYSGGVYVGRYSPQDSNNRLSKMVITTWENQGYGEDSDTEEYDKPQLALQNVTSEIVGMSLIKTGHFSTFKVDTQGNLNIALSASDGSTSDKTIESYNTSSEPENCMIVPEYSEQVFLGEHYKRFKTIYLGRNGTGEFISEDGRFDSLTNNYYGNSGQYNDPKYDKLAIDIHGGGIQLGRSPDDITISNRTYGLRMIDRSIKLQNKFFENAHIMGADIRKENDESLIINTSKPNAEYFTSGNNKYADVMLLAGLLEDKIDNDSEDIYSIVKQIHEIGSSVYFDEISQMYFLANGGINCLNTFIMHSLVSTDKNNYSIIRSRNRLNGLKEKLVIAAGIDEIYSDYTLGTNSDNNSYSDIINSMSILELVAGKYIRFYGDIKPIIEGEDLQNPLSISPKSVSITRNGFILGKLLELKSCNATVDNLRFYSFYEQPFSRFMDLNLDLSFDSIVGSNITTTIGSYNSKVNDIFKFAKWARIGNMILLKFYLNLSFNCASNQNAKLSFKLPEVSIPGQNEGNTNLFEGNNNYLTLEVEGTDATQYAEQDGVTEITSTVKPKIYHPVEIMFSRDFDTVLNAKPNTDISEKECKVLVPAYASFNTLGQPNAYNEYGTIPYSNPFSTYSIKFSVSKGSSVLNLDPLRSYLTSYPTGGNTVNFDSVKSLIDFMIAAHSKNNEERSDEEIDAINSFDFMFFSWESFKKDLESRGFSLDLDKSFGAVQNHARGTKTTWSMKISSSIYRYDGDGTSYDGFTNIYDGGNIGIETYSNNFLNTLNVHRNSIVRINTNQFGGSNQVVYLRISSLLNPVTNNLSSIDTGNKIGQLYANDTTVYIYAPMIKVYDLRLGQKKRWTIATEGQGSDSYYKNENSSAKLLINNNAW